MKHVNKYVVNIIAEQKGQENSMFWGAGPSQLRVDHNFTRSNHERSLQEDD